MKRILCSLLVAAMPLGSAVADAPKTDAAKVTVVYEHELPNLPVKIPDAAVVLASQTVNGPPSCETKIVES